MYVSSEDKTSTLTAETSQIGCSGVNLHQITSSIERRALDGAPNNWDAPTEYCEAFGCLRGRG